jgi:pimeloyl-ACP methyl ester carboxylesterase
VSVTVRTHGLVMVEHEFEVPLDHDRPDGPTLTVFAREVADPLGRDRPFLVFLSGGPGSEAPRVTRHPTSPAWLDRALSEYRVLLLDQRGTGRSTPVGTLPGMSADEQAEYLSHFRADSIVRDAELIRRALGVDSWSLLGQSFGGFCATTYLSQAPEGLREVFITGGVPPIGTPVDEVYAATFERLLNRCERYYRRYPGDRDRVRALNEWVNSTDVRLPNGDRLTWRRFQQIGNLLGMSDGAEHLHYVLELPRESPAFLADLTAWLPFPARNPLYTVIHEASYVDGGVSDWSADRVRPAAYDADVTLLSGEHVYPGQLEDIQGLKPLRDAAYKLASREWPRLYDSERLHTNEVACAAAIYAEDPYVERRYSERTATLIRGMRPWVTNEYDHNGLRADGGRILDRLIDLARGRR